MHNLLTLNYWFNLRPEPWLLASFRLTVIAFGVMVILGFLANLFIKKNKEDNLKKEFWNKVRNMCLFIGLVGLGLVFARQEGFGFLGMPFLLLLVCLWAIFWAYSIFRYMIRVVPEKREEQKKKEEKEKYL